MARTKKTPVKIETENTQEHSEKAEKELTGRERRLANLRPFKTGYDPRRNYHGRPKSSDELRELIRDAGQVEIELSDGTKVSRLYAKVLEMFASGDPRDNALILQYAFGKVPEHLEIKDERLEKYIDGIKKFLTTPDSESEGESE